MCVIDSIGCIMYLLCVCMSLLLCFALSPLLYAQLSPVCVCVLMVGTFFNIHWWVVVLIVCATCVWYTICLAFSVFGVRLS